MSIYISLLRGVNMAGHNKIKMTDLVTLMKKTGFSDAETYIQTGNIIFSAPENHTAKEIASTIEEAISKKFGSRIFAIVRTIKDIKETSALNPFLNETGFDPAKMAILFLTEEPSAGQVAKVADVSYPPDKFQISGKEIFIYCPNGFGRTKLYTNFFENKMKVTGTARNLKTINTILEIAEKKLPVG